ncbi:MAG: BamA/TamA family outer membrane protein, partial [Lentimicrobiaceae bacterium]|nr:BamA/TamA family outer membrane protein [Lentimicrobiaceae bacterium]
DNPETESPVEKQAKKKKEKRPDGVKTGWTFGVLPSVAFDADLGFQFGVLGNVFYYGDGSTFPDYMHSMYVEAAYTTKRYGIFRFSYDSKYLIPKHRFSFDVTYVPDAMCDFLGYNGYQAVYNELWRNSKLNPNPDYRTRAFYKYKRDLLRIAPDISGTIKGNWKWATGIGLLAYWTDRVNFDMINKNKKPEKMLPDTATLYDMYARWNIIKDDEAHGGIHPYVRAGFVYDSRNRQINASSGMYADAFFTYTAGFGKSSDYNNLKFNAVFQHYVPIDKKYATFAYRAGVQLLVAGNSPFYMDNYLNMLYYQRVLYEAIGGANSVRGLIRNRVLANGFGYATAEFRIRVWNFTIANQNFYLGFNPFCDMGIVLQDKKMSTESELRAIMAEKNPDDIFEDFFNFNVNKFKPHFGAGIGLKLAMNENFILSVDWAMPFNKQDNHSLANIYIKMGYLF